MNGARLVVCGGKQYFNGEIVFSVLDKLHQTNPIGLLIHGGDQTGLDMSAHAWARARKVRERRCRRNSWAMNANPNIVVAFPGGKDTQNMVRRAMAAGIPVVHAEAFDTITRSAA